MRAPSSGVGLVVCQLWEVRGAGGERCAYPMVISPRMTLGLPLPVMRGILVDLLVVSERLNGLDAIWTGERVLVITNRALHVGEQSGRERK